MTTMMTTMTTRTATKRKSLRKLPHSTVHPSRRYGHQIVWSIALLACLAGAVLTTGDAGALGIAANTSASQKKPSPNDGILYVTVFTEKGARFPDVAYTAHPIGKTKPRWEGYSDGRGEFAVRVSVQGDYEIELKAKGYEPQTRKVTSEVGDKTDIVFNLVPKAPKKP
jgi:hypothetical protein